MSEPIAWAVYGGKTGILRYVEQDDEVVRDLVDNGGYVARPLYELPEANSTDVRLPRWPLVSGDVRYALALTIAKSFPGWSEDTTEPPHVGWSEALRLHAEQHNERVNQECIRQGGVLADVILTAFHVTPKDETA